MLVGVDEPADGEPRRRCREERAPWFVRLGEQRSIDPQASDLAVVGRGDVMPPPDLVRRCGADPNVPPVAVVRTLRRETERERCLVVAEYPALFESGRILDGPDDPAPTTRRLDRNPGGR